MALGIYDSGQHYWVMPRTGKLIAFYSYRDGVGRTRTVADLAWILASNGHKVAAIDWNLEAPGLWQYFTAFLPSDYHRRSGLIDMLWDFLLHALAPSSERKPRWEQECGDVVAHSIQLEWSFGGSGALHLISAGQKGSYVTRERLFPWDAFMRQHGGAEYLRNLRVRLLSEFDFVLIDARTGMVDHFGISTVELADRLVACFQLVGSNARDLANALKLLLERRKSSDIRVFPVPTGIEYAEQALLQRLRNDAHQALSPFLRHLPLETRESYWGEVEVPYIPYLAYSKVASVFADGPNMETGVLSAMERLAGHLTDGEVTKLMPLAESVRARILRDSQEILLEHQDDAGPTSPYVGQEPFFFVSYKREELSRIVLTINQITEMGYRVWWDEGIPGGKRWQRYLRERIECCLGVLVFLSEQSIRSEYVHKEVQLAADLGKPILPVRLDEHIDPASDFCKLVGQYQMVEDPRGLPSRHLEEALRLTFSM